MGKVLCFGELLLRICPDGDGQWLAENKLPFYIGGAELNVAAALALWNVPTAYFTALPVNFMGDEMLRYIKTCQIDTSFIKREGERIGLYYLPKGKDLKNTNVIYDRAYTSFAELKPHKINWNTVLKDVSWFHFSAICPALNQQIADICLEALAACQKRRITISLDLNYRPKLWQYGKQPLNIMPDLAKYANLIMGNIWAAEKMLGIKIESDFEDNGSKTIYLKQAEITSRKIKEIFSNCKTVANTFRFDIENNIKYYTTLYQDCLLVSQEYNATKIVDKVGSGDCFMAGLIYGFYNQHQPQQIVNYATAAAFNKLFIASDCTNSTVSDIQNFIKNEK